VLIAPNGGEERIEFLCAGQQCVLHGIHPDTQKPYRWHGIPLWDIDRGELAGITAEQALALLNAIVELLISKFGYRRKDARHTSGPKDSARKPWTHVWRSKVRQPDGTWKEGDTNIPCVPNGREYGPGNDGYPPWTDGRIYAEVIGKVRQPDGTWQDGPLSCVPKDELFAVEHGKAGNGAASDWPGVDDLIDHDRLAALAMKL
jgi:hypothetical protein